MKTVATVIAAESASFATVIATVIAAPFASWTTFAAAKSAAACALATFTHWRASAFALFCTSDVDDKSLSLERLAIESVFRFASRLCSVETDKRETTGSAGETVHNDFYVLDFAETAKQFPDLILICFEIEVADV